MFEAIIHSTLVKLLKTDLRMLLFLFPNTEDHITLLEADSEQVIWTDRTRISGTRLVVYFRISSYSGQFPVVS